MSFADFMRFRSGFAGIGVLAFALLAIVSLFAMTDDDEHPLALETGVDLCGLLGDDIWAALAYPASNPIARRPANAGGYPGVCALELDPVPPDDRWARVARGDDADEIRRIATVTLTTTGALRRHNPEGNSGEYAENFGEELVADGWNASEVEGPWSWGVVYTKGPEEAATLAEDDGVVLWVTATGIDPDSLVAFTRSASQRLRPRD